MINFQAETEVDVGNPRPMGPIWHPSSTEIASREATFDAAEARRKNVDRSEERGPELETATIWIAGRRRIKTTIAQPIEEAKSEIQGAILEEHEENVNCEFKIGDETKQLLLPKALFDVDIWYGMPITLAVEEDNGVRKMVVKRRAPEMDEVAEYRQEMKILIDKLK